MNNVFDNGPACGQCALNPLVSEIKRAPQAQDLERHEKSWGLRS